MMFIEKLRDALNKVSTAYIFVGDGEPYYVLNPVAVERRKSDYAKRGISVEIIPVTSADIGEDDNLDRILNSGGDVVETKQAEVENTSVKRTRKTTKK